MALTITRRCNRCRQPMRNDGTEEMPKWVCNNPKCVKYVPEPEPTPEPTPEPEPEQTDETADETAE